MKSKPLSDHITRFNEEYRRVTGREPQEDAWIWAHVFGTVLSEWSEESYSCQWCEIPIQGRVLLALKQVDESPPLDRTDAIDTQIFAMLYNRVGCMVTLDDIDPDRYIPIALGWRLR